MRRIQAGLVFLPAMAPRPAKIARLQERQGERDTACVGPVYTNSIWKIHPAVGLS